MERKYTVQTDAGMVKVCSSPGEATAIAKAHYAKYRVYTEIRNPEGMRLYYYGNPTTNRSPVYVENYQPE